MKQTYKKIREIIASGEVVELDPLKVYRNGELPVSEQLLRYARDRGHINGTMYGGTRWVYLGEDIGRWLQKKGVRVVYV